MAHDHFTLVLVIDKGLHPPVQPGGTHLVQSQRLHQQRKGEHTKNGQRYHGMGVCHRNQKQHEQEMKIFPASIQASIIGTGRRMRDVEDKERCRRTDPIAQQSKSVHVETLIDAIESEMSKMQTPCREQSRQVDVEKGIGVEESSKKDEESEQERGVMGAEPFGRDVDLRDTKEEQNGRQKVAKAREGQRHVWPCE